MSAERSDTKSDGRPTDHSQGDMLGVWYNPSTLDQRAHEIGELEKKEIER